MAVTVNGAVLTQTDVSDASPSTLTYTSVVLAGGDVLVAVLTQNGSTAFPAPAAPTGGTGLSWTQIVDEQNTAAHFSRVTAYWAPVGSGQTSTLTQSTTVGAGVVGTDGALYRLSGADTSVPVGVSAVFQGQTDPTGASLQVTGTATGSMIFLAASDWSAGTAALTISLTGVASTTTDLNNLESGQFRGVGAHGAQSSSTSQATLDYTAATGDWAAVVFEIKQASASVPDPGPQVVPMFLPTLSYDPLMQGVVYPMRPWQRRFQWATQPWLNSDETPAVLAQDSLPVLTAPPAPVSGLTAPQPLVTQSRDVTPLQPSASPPQVSIAPPARLPALAPAPVLARSTADQVSADAPPRPVVVPLVTRPADPVRVALAGNITATPVVLQQNDFEGQTDGVTISNVNSDDFGGAAFTNTSGAGVYSTAAAAHGSVSALFNIASGVIGVFDIDAPNADSSFAVRFYLNLSSLPSVTSPQFPAAVRSLTGAVGRLEMSDAGQLRISTVGTSAYTTLGLTLGTTYRIEWFGTGFGGVNTSSTVEIYVGDSLTVYDTVSLTGQTTSSLIQRVRYLKAAASPAAAIAGFIDDVAQTIGSSTRIGPVVASPATPTAPLLAALRPGPLTAPTPILLGQRTETAVLEPPVVLTSATALAAPRTAPPALLARSTADPAATADAPTAPLALRPGPTAPFAAPASTILGSRDVTALQPSSNPAAPILGRAGWSTTAPPAILSRSTADPTATDSPTELLLVRPGAIVYSAPTAALAGSRDVTPLQPSDSPPATVLGRALWATSAPASLLWRPAADVVDVPPAPRPVTARAARLPDLARVFSWRAMPPAPVERRTNGALLTAPQRPPGAARAWLLTPRAEPSTTIPKAPKLTPGSRHAAGAEPGTRLAANVSPGHRGSVAASPGRRGAAGIEPGTRTGPTIEGGDD